MSGESHVYITRVTSDVGIGNAVYYATEQHPKKQSDSFGVLTVQTTQYPCYADAQHDRNPTNMMVKITKTLPLLRASVSLDMQAASKLRAELRNFINKHVHSSYNNPSSSSEKQPWASGLGGADVTRCKRHGEIAAVNFLSDAIYVLEVTVGETPAVPEQAYVPRQLVPPPKKQKVATNSTATLQFEHDHAVHAAPMANSEVRIAFSRTEDVPLIMQAVFYFFHKVPAPKPQKRVSVVFANGVVPAWVRIGRGDEPPDYRKTRTAFSNEEAAENITGRKEWHYSTWFTLQTSHITSRKKMQVKDGTWTHVLYAEYDKVSVCNERNPRLPFLYAPPVCTDIDLTVHAL